MSDRDLQDQVITALADAPFRSSPEWLARDLADPDRVERFARFLAKHFYYERIVHFFKYSSALSRVTGRRPETVLSTPAFRDLTGAIVLGSRASAAQVAALVVEHIGKTPQRDSIPYLGDLLSYEKAMMIAESGPRRWRDDQSGEPVSTADASAAVHLGEGTQWLDMGYDITTVLGSLLREWTGPPQAPKTPIRLLLARSEHGRVIVAHSTDAMEYLVGLADGQMGPEEIIERSGFDEAELRETLAGLIEWGALKVSVGS